MASEEGSCEAAGVRPCLQEGAPKPHKPEKPYTLALTLAPHVSQGSRVRPGTEAVPGLRRRASFAASCPWRWVEGVGPLVLSHLLILSRRSVIPANKTRCRPRCWQSLPGKPAPQHGEVYSRHAGTVWDIHSSGLSSQGAWNSSKEVWRPSCLDATRLLLTLLPVNSTSHRTLGPGLRALRRLCWDSLGC